MRVRTAVRCGVFVAAVVMLLALAPTGVSAHERRTLAGGKYQTVVGFLNEPAFEGAVNGLDLTVTDESQKGADGKGKPVEGLEKTLKAEVLVPSGAKRDLTVAARFGQPGKYAAYFVPTQPGAYTFHVYGIIGEQRVDERFESGPGRFNDIQSLAEAQFPHKVAVPADLQAQLDGARSEANTARTFGIVGTVVGVLGLVAGGLGLARRPSRGAVA